MKNLNDYFSNLYCVNLDSRPDRYELAQAEFKKLDIDVERVSGIVGVDVYRPGLNRTAGAYGILLTHIKIIEDAISKLYDSIVILEDDVTFIDGFQEKFESKIAELPEDWDLLYLGGNNVFVRGNFNLITGDKSFVPTNDNYQTLDHELCKTTWTQCAHALAINSKFYERLLNAIKVNSTMPVDSIHCMLQQGGCNAYSFLPSLALQRPSFSDIENTFVDYSKNKANGF